MHCDYFHCLFLFPFVVQLHLGDYCFVFDFSVENLKMQIKTTVADNLERILHYFFQRVVSFICEAQTDAILPVGDGGAWGDEMEFMLCHSEGDIDGQLCLSL